MAVPGERRPVARTGSKRRSSSSCVSKSLLATVAASMLAFSPSAAAFHSGGHVIGCGQVGNKVGRHRGIRRDGRALSSRTAAGVSEKTSFQRLPFDCHESISLRASSAPMGQSNLAVSIDQPLLSPAKYRPPASFFWRSLLSILVSDAFKTALVAFSLAFILSIIARITGSAFASSSSEDGGLQKIGSPVRKILSGARHYYKLARGRMSRVMSKVASETREKIGVPMPFTGEDGWGVCTLQSKKRIGRSSFVQYDFDLPKSDYMLPLQVGQQLSFCCLDDGGNVAKGDFFPYSRGKEAVGSFSIVSPDRTFEENVASLGNDRANFARVLERDLRVGDEVAIKPAGHTLVYRGQYLPVTDMVYLVSGMGIVPIVDQVKAIMPSGSSSVKGVSVIWVNGDEKEFDIAMDQLESEYFKYSAKLAVSCIIENSGNAMDENLEIDEAVPYFNPGTMAVVSGPQSFTEEARHFLIDRGYPEDCICVVP